MSVLRRKRNGDVSSEGGDRDEVSQREGESNSRTSYQRGWLPKKKTPAYQVLERKLEGERLGRRVQGLLERTNAISNR